MRRIEVFAVEDTTAQVCWAGLPAGTHVLEAGGREVTVESDGAPGAVVLQGLEADTPHRLRMDGKPVARFTTLPAPAGRLLAKFATITDIHIGTRNFGAFIRIPERVPDGLEPHPMRCTRAALDEALAWGAEAVVVKGDLTARGRHGELVAAAELLASLPVPVEAVPGNHDVFLNTSDVRAVLRDHGMPIGDEPWARDLPGIRLVMGLSAIRGQKHGEVWPDQRMTITELLRDAPAASFVAFHHYPQRFERANVYPPGIPRSHAVPLLEAIAEANPRTVVSSGHTHRHRRHQHGPVIVTETGSTKDYPGTWTGYAVHEDGIRQVTRRVMAPTAIAWTEHTRKAIGGIWGRWSPGRLEQRCFTHNWP
jgi:3',5'-cyclic AMP phosphodiesterase CpdA